MKKYCGYYLLDSGIMTWQYDKLPFNLFNTYSKSFEHSVRDFFCIECLIAIVFLLLF